MCRLACLVAVLASCGDSHRPTTGPGHDAPPVDTAYVPPPDAPPPTVDAPPAPAPACTMDAGDCQLPPSTCLDQWYLLYYTGGDCVDGTCQFTTNLMYCPETCQSGGCLPGFT
jgi:hypothetical protein